MPAVETEAATTTEKIWGGGGGGGELKTGLLKITVGYVAYYAPRMPT